MRLFDLIEEHHGIRMPPHRLGELPALVVADIARRRTDEPRHGVLLHVFAHVESDDGILVIEKEFGQRLAQLGFTHPGGPEKHE